MNVASFFAGCGGLDLGFEQSGVHVVWANELEPHCRATYICNHPNTEFVLGDICKIDPHSIPDCDGFIGGPPCQSWSVGGKQKGLDDERGQLFLKYIELIKAKQPKFFVIENVKGMLDSVFKYIFIMFLDRLDKAGYDVKWKLLDAVNYRIPQKRERVFIVGFRKDLNIDYTLPAPTCTEPVTLERAIGDITEEPNFLSGRKGDNIVKHNLPNHDVLTPRECARLQNFPEDFQPDVKQPQAYKQFGNAVNVGLVKYFAQFMFGETQEQPRCYDKGTYQSAASTVRKNRGCELKPQVINPHH
ncbi:MAG: DNA cytosine methyltransferase [Bacteroidaceae bacterium]|nr:DNA cytosine methyltransferase [Bacteroidaceae bacterium]